MLCYRYSIIYLAEEAFEIQRCKNTHLPNLINHETKILTQLYTSPECQVTLVCHMF